MISKPILIIGSNGFIGQGLSKHLSELGHQVFSINSRLSVSDSNLSVNLLDSDACEILCEYQFQYVFNCAGYVDHAGYFSGGSDVFDQHFTLVKNLVDHLNWDCIESFVQVGSSDEYGSQPAPQHEEMREQSISPYSCGKSLATHFLQMLARTEGLPIQIARLFLVYGPGQKANRFLPQLIKSCLQNDSIDVSAGEQMRDFLYIDDAVSGLIKCS
jgi:Nucleoside-diphosphate-sugar epimerases